MAIKNLMREIVSNTVKEVLSNDKSLVLDRVNRDDIIAYVLNRVPPKYITSERGVLHGKIDVKYTTQQRADILFLIYEAINEVIKRRDSEIVANNKDYIKTLLFPYIIGQVLEESTLSIIPDIEISLIYGENFAKMTDPDWKNPYITSIATKGYYHFWPEYSESIMGKDPKISFQLIFNHPKLIEKTINIELDLVLSSDMGKSHLMPISLLKARDGVDLNFLYLE